MGGKKRFYLENHSTNLTRYVDHLEAQIPFAFKL